MDAKIEQTSNKILFRLQGMVQRGRSVSAYLNRSFYQQFLNAQQQRFQTQNASQQGEWKALDPLYLKRRIRKWPASGDAILVRTQALAKGSQGLDSSYFYKTVSDDQFIFGINRGAIPYSQYPGAIRPFMSFTQATLDSWHAGISNYIFRGIG